jgi:hypothetical protein
VKSDGGPPQGSACAAALAAGTAPVTPSKLPPVTLPPVHPLPKRLPLRRHGASSSRSCSTPPTFASPPSARQSTGGSRDRLAPATPPDGWLFLALGVAADLIALGMPSCAANLWQARQRAASLVGWMLWLVTFVFAVTAGLGFASTNLSDVTLARASRVTPAVTMAQTALSDGTIARDRECKGGVGKFCRDREALVAERRQILDAAQTAVGLHADPQTDAAIRLAAWTSRGLAPNHSPSTSSFLEKIEEAACAHDVAP